MKKETKEVTKKKVDKKTSKVVTKEVSKKDTKKVDSKPIKKEKKHILKSIRTYFKNVNGELKKTKWPTKKELFSYSLATLLFIVVFALFFSFGDIIIAGIKQVLR